MSPSALNRSVLPAAAYFMLKRKATGMPRHVVQSVLNVGCNLYRQWPSLIPQRLARATFRILSAQSDLLTYREADIELRCYKSHWVAYSMGTFEPVTRRVLESLLHPGMTFVDGGANVGLYSVLASKLVGSKGLVHAFEPHPGVYAVLTSNLAVNRSDNVKPWNVALGATRETALLHDSVEPGSHTLVGVDSARGHLVHVLPLDEILGEDRVDLVKLDLEGSEPLALQGMKSILARRRKPIVVMEFCSDWLQRSKASPLEVIGFLESYGYKLKAIDDRHQQGPFNLDLQERHMLAGRVFDYNLLCIPQGMAV